MRKREENGRRKKEIRVVIMLFSLRSSLIVMTHKLCSGKPVSTMIIHVSQSMSSLLRTSIGHHSESQQFCREIHFIRTNINEHIITYIVKQTKY